MSIQAPMKGHRVLKVLPHSPQDYTFSKAKVSTKPSLLALGVLTSKYSQTPSILTLNIDGFFSDDKEHSRSVRRHVLIYPT